MATKRTVLKLYKDILRTSRTWKDKAESQWIKTEASTVFRQHQNISDTKSIQQLIAQGEERLTVAKWSGIPYERPIHMGGGGGEGLAIHKENPIVSKGRKRVNNGGKTVWKNAF